MRWLPRFETMGWSSCDGVHDDEGRSFLFRWGRFVVEICIGRDQQSYRREN